MNSLLARPFQRFAGLRLLLSLLLAGTGLSRAALITSVVETGGINEPTDTITARYTGQTFNVSVAGEPAPGLAVNTPFTVPPFGSSAPSYVDRPHRYFNNITPAFNIPSYLTGLEYIMCGNDNRDRPAYRLDITVNQSVRVYMLIDNRLSDNAAGNPPAFGAGAMQWILDEAWAATNNGINRNSNPAVPDEVAFDEASDSDVDQWFSVYYKDFPAGTFALKQADNGGRNMYGVVIGPAPGVVPPITTFARSPGSIPEGGTATLSWKIVTDATSAVIDNGVGNILPITDVNGEGSINVSPATDTTYTLTVNTPGGSQQSSVSVGIQLIESFTASAPALLPYESVTLQWNVRSGASVSISGIGDVTAQTNAQGIGSITHTHTVNTYTLTATRNAVTATATATIGFLPPSPRYALIDIGAVGGIAEAGAAGGFEVGAGATQTSGNLITTPLTSDTADPFTIAIDNVMSDGTPIGTLDWRDRGDAPEAPLNHLVEDFVKNNLGIVHVTLGSLPAGTYDVLTYHMDPGLSQSEEIKISVLDADSGPTPRDTGVIASAAYPGHPADVNSPAVASLTTNISAQKGFLFSIRSDGNADVSIYFDSRFAPVDDECPLNGLVLISRPVSIFNIVAVQHTSGPVTDTVSLEFESIPGQNYRVVTSANLQTWTTVNPLVPAHPTNPTTVFTDPLVPKSDPRRYYKVEKIGP